jgi:putative DNA primase/helicase
MMGSALKSLDFADVADDAAIVAAVGVAAPKAKLPPGFSYQKNGLYFTTDGDEPKVYRVAGKLDVLAQTRDDAGSNWGLLLRWDDDDGKEHRWAMPREMLAGDGTEIRAKLYRDGCYVAPGQARTKLVEFLGQVTIDTRALAVDRVGWAGPAFALPDRTIADTPNNRVLYQGSASQKHPYVTRGDLRGWQEAVAKYGDGNSRVALALSAAFVGPLLALLGEEGGGVNFRGKSSIGKSTVLIAAGSVWGRPDEYVRQWRATSNGLEGVAVQHSETLLCLDELGQLDGKEAGSVAYMLANGSGKARAGRSGAARASASWRVMFLSSGEISLADLAGRDGRSGRRSAAGQEVRILDIEADAGSGLGLFEKLHGIVGAETLSRTIKEGAALHYGVAGPAFVEALAPDRDRIALHAKAGIDAFIQNVVPASADGQVRRAARRFALIAMAGEVAIGLGILPWAKGEAKRAAASVFTSWLDGRGGVGSSEDREAVSRVRGFLEAHGSSRFEPLDRDPDSTFDPKTINRAGFVETVDGLRQYLIMAEAWKNEVCAGCSPSNVARALADHGHLSKDGEGKLSIPRALPGMGKARVYVVKASIFGGEDAA